MKNRKKHTTAVRVTVAVQAILALLLLGGAGIGYVGLRKQLYGLSQEIEQKERRLQALRVESAQQAKQLATLRSPSFLHVRAGELNLGLVPPQPAQIVRLMEPVAPVSVMNAETAQDAARRLQVAESGQRMVTGPN